MSSPSSSFHVHHTHSHLHRKEVPGGSQDFQKVLDTILLDEEENHRHFEKDKLIAWDDVECKYFDENPESRNYYDNDSTNYNTNTREFSDNDDNNNDYSNINSKRVCELERCRLLNRDSLNPSPVPVTSTSPSGINVFDCNGDLLYSSEDDRDEPHFYHRTQRTSPLVFPPIDKEDLKDIRSRSELPSDLPDMGTNCSTGIYDHRDWHDIIVKDSQLDKKGRKRGKPTRKKQLNLNSNKDSNCCVVTAQLCTCKHRVSDSSPDPVSESIPIPGSGINITKDKNSSDSSLHDKGVAKNSPLSSSPNSLDKPATVSRSVSPNQGRLSKMLGIKILSSSSPKADVSPHRLLVRRSYSPKSRASSMEEMIRQNNDSIYRQRSCSWSNGKLHSKPTTHKSNSIPLIQSPILSPVANHSGIAISPRYNNASHVSPCTYPRATIAGEKSPKDKIVLFPDVHQNQQLVSNNTKSHEHTCPLFKLSQQKDRDTDSSFEEDEDNLTPMARRRAVSESQTLRSRQKARRAAANAAANSGSQDGDHLHVHWADEGGNSSLSTSVFLSSIRPRSYSHGAVSNTPHRPILKKVIIS